VTLAGSGTPGFAIEPDKTLVITAPSPIDNPSSSNVLEPALDPSIAVPPTSTPVKADDLQPNEPGNPADRVSAASLAAAVAAQDIPPAVDSDLACLAGTIYFEAKGEPLAGQLAVANVVINRMNSGRFPRSICSVVTQRGQFSFIRGGRVPSIAPTNASYRTAIAVARVAMEQRWESPVADALFFHARHVSPGWRLTRVAAIGGHIFYR
jgi:spore germination cell wall hydrolase CwlJ-like protein